MVSWSVYKALCGIRKKAADSADKPLPPLPAGNPFAQMPKPELRKYPNGTQEQEGYYKNDRGGYAIMTPSTAKNMGWTQATQEEFENSHREAQKREQLRIAEQKRIEEQNRQSGMVKHPETGQWYNPTMAAQTKQKMDAWQSSGRQAAVDAWNKSDPNESRRALSERTKKRQSGGLTTYGEYKLRTGDAAPTQQQLTQAKVQPLKQGQVDIPGKPNPSTAQQLGMKNRLDNYRTVGDKAAEIWGKRFPGERLPVERFNKTYNAIMNDPMYYGEQNTEAREAELAHLWASVMGDSPSPLNYDVDDSDDGEGDEEAEWLAANSGYDPTAVDKIPYTPYWQNVIDRYDYLESLKNKAWPTSQKRPIAPQEPVTWYNPLTWFNRG